MNPIVYLVYSIAIVYGLFHVIFNVLPVLIDSHTIGLWDAVICALVADHYLCDHSYTHKIESNFDEN